MINVEHLSGVGEALKELRWRARMKQIEVCRATGMTAPQVSRYENGHEMPTVESLVKYLGAVGADLCILQRVLIAESPAAESPTGGEPAAAAPRPSALEQVRDEGDRRLESSAGFQKVVTGLVELNIQGMERLEYRMKSMEERLEDLRNAG